MIITILFVAALLSALALIASSAWLKGTAAYIAILILLGAALALGEARDAQPITALTVAVNFLIFGFFFYYVTVQHLLGRKASDVASRSQFKETMESEQRFSGFVRALYYLPIFLVIAAVICALIGSYTQNWNVLEG